MLLADGEATKKIEQFYLRKNALTEKEREDLNQIIAVLSLSQIAILRTALYFEEMDISEEQAKNQTYIDQKIKDQETAVKSESAPVNSGKPEPVKPLK